MASVEQYFAAVDLDRYLAMKRDLLQPFVSRRPYVRPHLPKERRYPLSFRKQILRGERFRDRLDKGLDRRLHVCRLLRLDGAGPRQFVLGDIVERSLRGVLFVTVRAG